ncbi:MAG TPA: hypothetical protein VF516_01145 [Kofleriaceae bacterium]
MIARFLLLLAAASAACGSSNDAGCHSNEVEVDNFRGARDGAVVCKPIPASCNGTASCADNSCIRDMYGLCDAPYLGVACSDTFPPTIISCNP